MQTIRSVHIFFCFFGVIASSLFIYVLISRSSQNLHVNLRLSLTSLSLAAWIACAQLLLIAVYSLMKTLTEDNACNSLYEAKWCAIARFPVVLSIYATLCGILILAVERTIATLNYKSYEVHGSRIVAVMLIGAQWSLSIFLAVISVLVRADPGYVHYCTVYVSHPRTAVFSLCVMSILEAVALVYFIVLLHSNQRRQVNEFVNNAMHTLTERYQLQENVRIMRILIPSVTVHAVLGMIGLISLLVFAIIHRTADERMVVRFAPFSELALLVVPIYAVVFPFVAVVRNKQLWLASRRALPCLFNERSTPPTNERLIPSQANMASRQSKQTERDSAIHFDMLQEMWKK
ncbi:Serpentine receptor class alpha/beta-14, variant 2 [Parelaphostrongylus tenuis]|nr:Serpentine receptor class alpha/beta-14, variant 2 [Parelaphostrongylus tenuis]